MREKSTKKRKMTKREKQSEKMGKQKIKRTEQKGDSLKKQNMEYDKNEE